MFEFEDVPGEDAPEPAAAAPRKRARAEDAAAVFQLVEAFSEARDGATALLLFGRDAAGASHLVRVADYCAHFYVACAGEDAPPVAAIERECGPVAAAERVARRPLFFYHAAPVDMWRVTLRAPERMRAAEKALPGRALYETDVPYVTQALRDARVGAMAWVRVAGARAPGARCDWEWDVPFAQLGPAPDAPPGNAPLRITSFDIECLSSGGFPSAERGDPVITISLCTQTLGRPPASAANTVIQLGACGPVPGAQVLAVDSEAALLRRFAELVAALDPDVLTGYNINGFDWRYVMTRARLLGVDAMPDIGRAPGVKARFYDKTFQSKGAGTRRQTVVVVPGRVVFDVFMLVLATESLREYSLNSVAEKHLGDRKDDVPHTEIPGLFRGDAAARAVLAKYCVKDAHLVLRLIAARDYFANLAEMARETRVPINALLTRGQTIKVRTLLVYYAAEHAVALPAQGLPPNRDGYQGATVLDPVVGLHTRPVATLDFASLYPSIMRAHNLSHDTWVADPAAHGLAPGDVEHFPETNAYFVRAHVRRGLLPTILDNTIAARAAVRARQKGVAKDDPMHAVLEGQQLAMKLICNSIYGFTGAATEKLACQAISSTVTAVGRRMIQLTADAVVARYRAAGGYAHDARVLYGDTDSVMVDFGVATVAEAMALGRDAAAHITTLFRAPIKLEFEKVYCPYLLLSKKRYAGYYWTRPDKPDFLDAKGLETKRRDPPRLVEETVKAVLRMLLDDRSPAAALAHARGVVDDLHTNRVPLHLLIMSKKLSKPPRAYTAKPVHVQLYERMAARGDSPLPEIGSRVQYVLVQAPRGTKVSACGEDPLHMRRHGLRPDTALYVDMLRKPLERILGPFLRGEDVFAGTGRVRALAPPGGLFARWAGRPCAACRKPLPLAARGMCAACDAARAASDAAVTARMVAATGAQAAIWERCAACAGARAPACATYTCDQRFARDDADADVARCEGEMAAAGLEW